MQEPQSDRDRDLGRDDDKSRERRDLLLFFLLLLLGFCCLLSTAQMAVSPGRAWEIPANMLSESDPDDIVESGVLQIEPLRPEVMTPPAWNLTRLAPEGTLVVVPVVTLASISTATPLAVVEGPTLTPTPSPSPPMPSPTPTDDRPTSTMAPSPTVTPTPSQTPSPTPTVSQTPSSTLTPTPTPTATPTNTRVPTKPPPPPPNTYTPIPTLTDTSTPTATPTPTNTPTPGAPPPPTILSITPNWGYNDVAVQVVIRGENFFGMPVATLGLDISITISAATTDTLTGTVPVDIIAGVYVLKVENPDTQSDTLPRAYTALDRTAALGTGDVSTFGPDASFSEGDDDHIQDIRFDVPANYAGELYVRVFDADTGDSIDEWSGDTTTMNYTLYGGGVLSQVVIGRDQAYDGQWVSLFGPYSVGDGAVSGSRRVFRLEVEGASGNSGNVYRVAWSSDPGTNVAPPGSRMFAYSWTFPLAPGATRWLYPHVPQGTRVFEQHNWDMDHAGIMSLYTPGARDVIVIDVASGGISGNGAEANSTHGVQDAEDGATWSVKFSDSTSDDGTDHRTFWVLDGDSRQVLAIFIAPTTSPPP